MQQWRAIRQAVLADGMSKRQACREFGIHWETLRKILAHPAPPGYRRVARVDHPVMGPWMRRLAAPARRCRIRPWRSLRRRPPVRWRSASRASCPRQRLPTASCHAGDAPNASSTGTRRRTCRPADRTPGRSVQAARPSSGSRGCQAQRRTRACCRQRFPRSGPGFGRCGCGHGRTPSRRESPGRRESSRQCGCRSCQKAPIECVESSGIRVPAMLARSRLPR